MQRRQGADTARGGETSPPTSTHDALVKIMLYFHVRGKGVKHFFHSLMRELRLLFRLSKFGFVGADVHGSPKPKATVFVYERLFSPACATLPLDKPDDL